MALHAGFAAAISIAQETLQSIVHLEYINETFPTTIKGKTSLKNNDAVPPFTFSLSFDLVLAEPIIALKPNPKNWVDVKIELIGSLQFSAEGISTINCGVDVVVDVQVPVIMITHAKDKTVQLGLNSKAAQIAAYKATITSGRNPKNKYGFDLDGPAMRLAVLSAIFAIKPDQFLVTLPSFSQFIDVKYTLLGPSVLITDKSLNAGIDVKGVTSGVTADLKNLNTISTVRGWLKKFGPVHTADDEFGEPIYDNIWQASKQLSDGRHDSSIAVMLNKTIIYNLYKKIGRYEIFDAFETNKYNTVVGKLQELKGKDIKYNPPSIAKVVIHTLHITLHNDHFHVDANATYYQNPIVTTDIHFDLRIVDAEIFGETGFVSSHQYLNGFTGEVLNVNIDVPGWVTALEVLGGVAGVLLAPFTDGASLVVTMMFELVVTSIVSMLIGNAENTLVSSIMKNMAKDNGVFRFNLPGIKKPDLILSAEDIVVREEGLYSWFMLGVDTNVTATAAIKVTNYPKKYSDTTGWPIEARGKIHVKYTEKGRLYNPHDPKVRIRWEVFGNSTKHKLLEQDSLINNGSVADPLSIDIDHASANNDSYSKFIVKCRVYRPFGNGTNEIFSQKLEITITDLLDRTKTYVHWQHHVTYFRPSTDPDDLNTAIVSEERYSKIHYTDYSKRCLFADQYSRDLTKADLNYSNQLPFPIAAIEQHRDKICPYCFFGGPDKHVLKP